MVLCLELMKISSLVATGKDGTGQGLTSGAIKELLVFSSRLQLTLQALGMNSRELAGIAGVFDVDPQVNAANRSLHGATGK
jgi:hypothetical protein